MLSTFIEFPMIYEQKNTHVLPNSLPQPPWSCPQTSRVGKSGKSGQQDYIPNSYTLEFPVIRPETACLPSHVAEYWGSPTRVNEKMYGTF